MNKKQTAALQSVVDKFKSGDLGPIIKVITTEMPKEHPAYTWSFKNKVLAYGQADTLDVMGYRQWQGYGRQVKKGSKSSYILKPVIITEKNERTGKEEDNLKGWSGIAVFGLNETEGDDLPWKLKPKEPPNLIDVAGELGVKVNYTYVPADRYGDCDVLGRRINLGTESPKVFFHELAHAAHAKIDGKIKGGQHGQQETIAEFTAAVLMELYGYGDSSGNAWNYIKGYYKDPLRAMNKALGKINQVLELLFEVEERLGACAEVMT